MKGALYTPTIMGSAKAKMIIVKGNPRSSGYFTEIVTYLSIRASSFLLHASDMDAMIGREKAVIEKSTLETVSAAL